MKRAINLYLMNGDTKEKLDNIKNIGFDGVLLGIYSKNETMNLFEQIEYCKKIGLEISMIHCSYEEKLLNELWVNGSKIGIQVTNDLIQQIESIKNYNVKNFVIHTCGSKNTLTNICGLKRLKKILKVCEKYDINLCIENLYSAEQIKYIFDNLKSKNLKFCYDCGHENFLTQNANFVEEYANILNTTHVHDNHGETDEHLILGNGNIDIFKLARNLAKCNFDFLTAEIKTFNNNCSQVEILKNTYNSLVNLENLIQINKKNTLNFNK